MSSVAEFINSAQAYANQIRAEALEATDRLESIAESPFRTRIDFDPNTSVALTPIPPLTNLDQLPTLEKVTIDLSSVANFDPNSFKQATYVSPFFAFLGPQLIDFIQNGGPGISQSVQDALFGAMRERDLQLLSDALDVTRTNYGKRGFPLPTSMLRAQENELIKKYQDDRSNRNREITSLIAERAQDTMKAAVANGVRMEEVQSQFSLGFARLFVEVSTQLINQYRLLQDAAIAEFDGQIKAMLAKVQAGEANARTALGYQEQVLKRWQIEATLAVEETKALISQAENATAVKLQAAQGLAEFYKAAIVGTSGMASGIVQQSEDISTGG